MTEPKMTDSNSQIFATQPEFSVETPQFNKFRPVKLKYEEHGSPHHNLHQSNTNSPATPNTPGAINFVQNIATSISNALYETENQTQKDNSRKLENQNSKTADNSASRADTKALRSAFFTVGAFTIAFIVFASTYAVYLILQPFFQPLLWAFLIGGALFPVKVQLQNKITHYLKTDFNSIDQKDSGIIWIEIIKSPFLLLSTLSDLLANFILDKRNLAIILSTSLVSAIFYVINQNGKLWDCVDFFQNFWFILNKWSSKLEDYPDIVLTLCLTQLFSVLFVSTCNISSLKSTLKYTNTFCWIIVIAYLVSCYTGVFKVPLLILGAVIFSLAFFEEMTKTHRKVKKVITTNANSIINLVDTNIVSPLAQKAKRRRLRTMTVCSDDSEKDFKLPNRVKSEPLMNVRFDEKNEKSEVRKTEKIDSDQYLSDESAIKFDLPIAPDQEAHDSFHSATSTCSTTNSNSTVYFKLLAAGFAMIQAYRYRQLLVILVLLLIIKLLKYFAEITDFYENSKSLLPDPDLIVPSIIVALFKKSSNRFVQFLLANASFISTCVVLVSTLVSVIFGILFFLRKFQLEAVVFGQMLADQNWDNSLGNYGEKIHTSGRDYISGQVNVLFSDISDSESVEKIEEKTLFLWDTIYDSYFKPRTESKPLYNVTLTHNLSSNTTEFKIGSDNQFGSESETDEFESRFVSIRSIGSELEGIMETTSETFFEFLGKNQEIINSLFKNVYDILEKNAHILYYSVQTVGTIGLYGGMSIINFVVATVIFLMSLFYVMSASTGKVFYPIQFIMTLAPTYDSSQGGITDYTQIIQDAILSVFGASLKMALFHGLFTYLTHTVFEIPIRYIPAFCASICAVLPFVGTYWLALPGALYLFFIKQQKLHSISLFLIHLLPLFFVDPAIYGDVSQGHPYFTALAVAGGLYCFGFEGAIIGPLILCMLLSFVSIYRRVIRRQNDESEVLRKKGRGRGTSFNGKAGKTPVMREHAVQVATATAEVIKVFSARRNSSNRSKSRISSSTSRLRLPSRIKQLREEIEH